MMKCYTNEDYDQGTSDDLVDIQRSLEALDTVLAEHDVNPNSSNVRIKNNVIEQRDREEKKLPFNGLAEAKSFDLEQQSLDILDSILAEYEDDALCNTKENGEVESEGSHLKCNENKRFSQDVPDDTKTTSDKPSEEKEQVESNCDNEDTSSPQLQRLRKTPPPPVPKRSPSTCLSTSSSFDCPFPEADLEGSTPETFPQSPTNTTSPDGEVSPLSNVLKTANKKRRKLSSQPVEKGARPFVRSLSADRLDESDSDDDIFGQNEKVKESQSENEDTEANPSSMASQAVKNETNTEPSQHKHGDCGSVINVVAEIGNKKFALIRFLLRTGQLEGLDEKPPSFKPPPPLAKCTDVNKNEISINGSKEEEFLHSKPAPHITSVKIGEATSPGSQQANVSLITFQPKNAAPDADTRKSLSTFAQDVPKSPSQEDALQTQGSSESTGAATLPLELKNPVATNKGAVFFNVFQCDSPAQQTQKNLPPKEQAAPPKKTAKLQKKVKNKKKSKDQTAEDNNDSCKNNKDAAINLISELTDKIQTKKSASVGSADDDSDEEADESQQKMNAKEAKTEKGLWKGFWRKKQSTEN